MPPADSPAPLLTLHRYFITADLMRRHTDHYLNKFSPRELSPDSELFPDFFSYMSLWYSTLYVTLDGWQQLRIVDDPLAAALSDTRLRALNDFRNVTFHFRPNYIEPRHLEFIADSGSALWVRKTHNTLGTALLEALAGDR